MKKIQFLRKVKYNHHRKFLCKCERELPLCPIFLSTLMSVFNIKDPSLHSHIVSIQIKNLAIKYYYCLRL